MAVRHVLIERAPQAVWSVLGDPAAYGRWVPGTERTRPGEGRWPAVGSSLRYTVSAGPFRFEGHTVVRVSDSGHRLELEAFAGRLGTVRIAIELIAWGDATLVIVDEHPLRGLGGSLHTAPADLVLDLRHRRLLACLARTVEQAPRAADLEASASGGGPSWPTPS
ncbi:MULTISPECIES: SRPBCC family protein [Streptomycetaceae]|uniref:SRPBCC family protein n=1 Tax=Streptomycetaceae TaxID=2062 RepID=UPI00093C6250|nr:SRPBCC family protein [Streptomyces sp. CB02056]OKI06390.1 polyketide cyclase [Streptomyces sp. CB02056]